MASEVKANKLSPSSGTDLTLGDASDTVIVPTGATLNVVDGVGVAGGGTGLVSFTAGDVLYATGSTTLAKLAKGTAEQILSMNSGANAPEWTTAAATAGGTGQTGFTAGDLLYANSTTTLTKLGKGTARQGLQTNSGATAPEWVNSPQSLMTAEGDILYASGANTLAKLAKGSDDQVLTLASGVPSWAAAGGGAWNLLSTQTASGETTVDFVQGSGDIDFTTYKIYKMIGTDIDADDDDVALEILYSDDTGVSYETTNYEVNFNYTNYTGGATSPLATGNNNAALRMNDIGNAAGETGGFECTFTNLASTSLYKQAWYIGVTCSNGGSQRIFRGGSTWDSLDDVDAMRFQLVSGDFSGTFKLYGIS